MTFAVKLVSLSPLLKMPSGNQTPENQSRELIDEQLRQAGWSVQDKKEIHFNASLGVAIRE